MGAERDPFLDFFETWKRDSFSPYCRTQCQTTCCDLSRVRIELTKEGLVAVLGFEPDDLSPFEIDTAGRFTYDKGLCPQYDPATRTCGIYGHPDRPNACRRYPFEVLLRSNPEDKWVGLKSACEFSRSPEMEELSRVAGEEYQVDVFVFGQKR